MTYDRGYALQTKSILVESNTTAAEVVEQLSEALGLRGTPSDYALEERNVMTGGKRCFIKFAFCKMLSISTSFSPPSFSPLFLNLLHFFFSIYLPLLSLQKSTSLAVRTLLSTSS